MRKRRRVQATKEMVVAGHHIAEGDEGTITWADDVLIHVRWDGTGRAVPMMPTDPIEEVNQ